MLKMAKNVQETDEERCQRILREVQERLNQKAERDAEREEQKIASENFNAKVKQMQAMTEQECERYD